jgi:glyoxylase-like metal-dependent hydrolase (beta-lactamase superfamily II)
MRPTPQQPLGHPVRLLTALAALLYAVHASAADLPRLIAERVAGDVWYFRGESGQASADNAGYTSNAGFVVTPRGVLLFDALGTPALARAMLRAIAKVTDQPVRRVIVSHYHADHVYGLQVLRAAGATIWARREGQAYLVSDLARERLAERRNTLAPWVDAATEVLPADRWLDLAPGAELAFRFGGQRLRLMSAGHAHAPDDLMLLVEADQVLFAGDLYFNGRLPFVVDGNTRNWLAAIESMRNLAPRCIVPGHGAASCDPAADLATTAGYLHFVREAMGRAVEDLADFDSAYAATDWSRFSALPTFDAANRRNAYSVYLEMQAELLGGADAPR